MRDPEEIVDLAEQFYLELKGMVNGLGVNPTNFIMVVTRVVEKVETLKSLNGDESLTLATEVLEKLMNEIPNTTEADLRYLRTTIPGMVRTIISNSKGKSKFRTSKKALRKAERKGLANVSPVQVVDDIYHKLTVVIKKREYTSSYICTNLVVLSSMVMTMVEKYPAMSGMEKKNTVLKVLNRLVDDLPTLFPDIDQENVALVKQSLKSLPDVIDTVVAIGNNKFEINPQNIVGLATLLASFFGPCVKKCRK